MSANLFVECRNVSQGPNKVSHYYVQSYARKNLPNRYFLTSFNCQAISYLARIVLSFYKKNGMNSNLQVKISRGEKGWWQIKTKT